MIESLNEIDWSKVDQAILNAPESLLSFDYEDARNMVWVAAEKWLPSDLRLLDQVKTESGFNVSLGRFPTPGFIDLSAVYTRGEFAGKTFQADWKTSDGELDVNWQSRLIGSFQWKLYSYVGGADCFSYRGVNRKGKTREVFIRVPEYVRGQAVRQFSMVSDQMRALLHEDVWPMKMPSSCGAYNSICPFKSDCDHDTMPRYRLNADELHLSYSGMDRFQLCPEKFRRQAKAGKDDGNDSTRLGNAFHRGIECVYVQAFGLDELEKTA